MTQEYKDAIARVSEQMDNDPKYNAFDGSHMLAVTFGIGKYKAIEDIMDYRTKVEKEKQNETHLCTQRWRNRDRDDIKQANARLIAAAPDLLAAVKLALNAFEKNWAIDWNELEQAIEKAEGK